MCRKANLAKQALQIWAFHLLFQFLKCTINIKTEGKQNTVHKILLFLKHMQLGAFTHIQNSKALSKMEDCNFL